MTSLADQFEALSKAATQGHMRSMRDGNQYLDGLHSADGKSLVGASRVEGLDRPWNRRGAALFIDMEHVSRFRDEDADFIAFCFNNRTAISSALTSASPVQEGALSDIAVERRRQIAVEGWTAEHDADHDRGELARAAACYAWAAAEPHQFHRERMAAAFVMDQFGSEEGNIIKRMWPWALAWWKPKDKRRDLVRAAALIVAEIERLDRSTLPAAPEPTGVDKDHA